MCEWLGKVVLDIGRVLTLPVPRPRWVIPRVYRWWQGLPWTEPLLACNDEPIQNEIPQIPWSVHGTVVGV